jgi:ABC-2 type transport system ATP-binding protein
VRDLIAELRLEGKTVFMCSHILSDIEVLCDRVAILKRGRLSQVGHLSELRQQVAGQNGIEIVVTGTTEAALKSQIAMGNDLKIIATPAGLKIEVAEESEIDSVLAALRQAGGKLISVQPVKQSLEELFVD